MSKVKPNATMLKLRRILNDEAKSYRRFLASGSAVAQRDEWTRALYVIATIRRRMNWKHE